MRLVIDGYNLIHRIPELAAAQGQGQGRRALMAALRLYRQQRGHRITVVFDGGEDPGGGRATIEGVPAVFSGTRSADDVIADLARQQGPGLTVVSDDRELGRRCQASGAEVIGSGEFGQRLLLAALGRGEPPPEEDEGGWDFTTRKMGPRRRQPKARRQRQRRIDKL